MARPIWGGTISFGLVSIPVKLYAAVESHRLAFRELDEKTGKRIRYKRVAENSNREVPWEQIVRGFEVGKGRFVTLTKDELKAAAPEQTRTVDVEQFVRLDEIDPVSWDATYYVLPDGPQAQRAYALFREALRRKERVAIGRFVMRSKQYLVCLRPFQDIIALQTMFFPDEVRKAKDLPGADKTSLRGHERELHLATQIIDSLSDDWDPSRYHDTYRDEVMELVRKKAKGKEITVAEEGEGHGPGQVVDLMEALKASLAGGHKADAKGEPKTATKGAEPAHAAGHRRARGRGRPRAGRAGGKRGGARKSHRGAGS